MCNVSEVTDDDIWDQVKDPKNKKYNWLVCTFKKLKAKRKKLIVLGAGPGGRGNAVGLLKDDMVAYGGFRVTGLDSRGGRTSRRGKFVMFVWMGEKVPMMVRAKCNMATGKIQSEVFPGAHLTVQVSEMSDLAEEVLEKALRSAGGAHQVQRYDWTNNQGGGRDSISGGVAPPPPPAVVNAASSAVVLDGETFHTAPTPEQYKRRRRSSLDRAQAASIEATAQEGVARAAREEAEAESMKAGAAKAAAKAAEKEAEEAKEKERQDKEAAKAAADALAEAEAAANEELIRKAAEAKASAEAEAKAAAERTAAAQRAAEEKEAEKRKAQHEAAQAAKEAQFQAAELKQAEAEAAEAHADIAKLDYEAKAAMLPAPTEAAEAAPTHGSGALAGLAASIHKASDAVKALEANINAATAQDAKKKVLISLMFAHVAEAAATIAAAEAAAASGAAVTVAGAAQHMQTAMQLAGTVGK